MIFKGSRYDGALTFLDRDNGIVYIDPIQLPRFAADKDYLVILVQEGQRLDLIAHQLYGDAQLEWVLMDANPQLWSPMDIRPGDRIIAPSPERVISSA